MKIVDIYNRVSLAYGIAAAYYKNPLDSQGLTKHGLSVSAGFLKKLRMVRHCSKSGASDQTVPADFQEIATIIRGNPAGFNPREGSVIPFPQYCSPIAGQVSRYDITDDFLSIMKTNYSIFLIYINEPIKGVVGYVAIPHDNTLPIEIAFRGTMGTIGAVSFIAGLLGVGNDDCNIDMKTHFQEFVGSGQAVRGFASVANNVFVELLGILNRARPEIVKRCAINISGHSLGAAVAALIALKLKYTEGLIIDRDNISLNTLACPAVGDETFNQQFNEKFPGDKLTSYFIQGDPVISKFRKRERFPSFDLRPYLTQLVPKYSGPQAHSLHALATAGQIKEGANPKDMPCLSTLTLTLRPDYRKLAVLQTGILNGRPVNFDGLVLI